MVRDAALAAFVEQLSDMSPTPQDSVTPGWGAVFGRGVVGICAWVVLVRGRKPELALVEDTEHELRVPEFLQQELVVLVQVVPVLSLDVLHGVAELDVDTIVEIS